MEKTCVESPHKIEKFSIAQLDKILGNITGRVLTTIEAILPENRQLQATKDLLEQAVWADRKELARWAYQQTNGEGNNFPLWNPPTE